MVNEREEAGANVKVSDRYHGPRGLTEKRSVPHLIPAADSFQDANWSGYSGAATSYAADELRRSTQVTHPDGALSKWTYSGWDNEAIDRLGRKRKFERDALGRLIRVREYTGKNSWSEYAVTNYGRDVANRLVSTTDHSGNASSIGYDKLGRRISMTDPDMGSWSYEYHPTGSLKAQTDAKGQRTEFAYDVLGRLTRKYYPPSWTEGTITAGASRPTVYDIMELRSAVDVARAAAGVSDQVWTDPTLTPGVHRVRAIHFTQARSAISLLWSQAGLGSIPEFTAGAIAPRTRAIKASDLTDLRSWLAQYEQSSYGESRRARSIYEYDDYDGSSQYGRGRLTGTRDVSGRSRFYYDKVGRMWKTERTIDGNTYPFSWSRDALGRVYQMSYPDGEVLTYSYGADGHLSALASSIGGQIVSSIVYNALGRPSSYTLGASPSSEVRSTYYGLDAAGTPYGAMKTLQWQQGTSPMLIDREMLYDASGNLTRLTDRSNSETINFVYDDLDRLTSAGAPVSESYGYDRIGNLTTKNGQALSYTDPAHKHAVSGFGGVSYGYDANGDMVSRGSQSIGYDPERRPVRVVAAGVTQWRTSFGADGKRRKRLDGAGTIHYVGPYERKVGAPDGTEAVTKHYYALGKLLAVRKNGTLSYLGSDQLGSPIRVADASFSPVDRMRYTPFGNSRDTGTSLPTDRRFTGQTQDASVGLYWYGSRAYDPAIGRFTSPDTIVPTILNPQGLNRYSYVTNNPLAYTDPSGHAMRFYLSDPGNVYVVSEAEGIYGLAMDLIDPNSEAVTLSDQLIISRIDIASPDKENTLSHEMGHVMQAQLLGNTYLSLYVSTFAALLAENTLKYQSIMSPSEVRRYTYNMHPMEIAANLNVGLPPYWHANTREPFGFTPQRWSLKEVVTPPPAELIPTMDNKNYGAQCMSPVKCVSS